MTKLNELEIKAFKSLKKEFGSSLLDSVFIEHKSGYIASPVWVDYDELEEVVEGVLSKKDIENVDLEELFLNVRDIIALPQLVEFYSEILVEENGEELDTDLIESVKEDIDRISSLEKQVS